MYYPHFIETQLHFLLQYRYSQREVTGGELLDTG